ncbi:MAG: TRAP transporter large permease subunit [Rubrimonas sp.]
MQRAATLAARGLARTTETAAALLLILVTLLNLTQVGGRYFFATGFSWTEELMRYAMIWLMMLGSVACVFRAEHMGIQTLEALAPPRHARHVRSATYSVAAVFCAIVLLYGYPLALRNAAQSAPASGIPMILPYLALARGHGADAAPDRAQLAFRLRARRRRGRRGCIPGPGGAMIWVAALGLGLLFVGVPVAFALGLAGVLGVWLAGIPLGVTATRLFTGVDSFVFLAVPFYILAAEIMSQGGITARLIAIASAATGRLRGGTAFANIGSSVLFAGISGSAVADAAALGRVFCEEMPKEGYTREYSAAVTAASSIVGPIIPPSGLAIIMAAVTGLSVIDLFLAGVLPGLLLAGACAAVVVVDALRGRVPKPRRARTVDDAGRLRMWVEALAVITLPLIIVGGMIAGIYTATEGGGIAVAYATFLSVAVFRVMTLQGLWLAFLRAARTSASIYLLVAAATILSYALNILGISRWVADVARFFDGNPVLFLFAVAALMLVLGTFLDIGAAILIFAPLLMPVVRQLGIDPMQAAMVIMLTLAMGLLTPPVGVVLFVMMRVGRVGLTPLIRALAPFLLAQLAAIAVLCLVPGVSTFLPDLLN